MEKLVDHLLPFRVERDLTITKRMNDKHAQGCDNIPSYLVKD